jgi:hypothetical protein
LPVIAQKRRLIGLRNAPYARPETEHDGRISRALRLVRAEIAWNRFGTFVKPISELKRESSNAGSIRAGQQDDHESCSNGHPPQIPRGQHEDRAEGRRTKTWNLPDGLHCSIIGTCLTAVELRAFLRKFNLLPDGIISDHDIHIAAICAADRRETLAKHINKILDIRHKAIIHQFSKAREALEPVTRACPPPRMFM